MEGKPLHQIWVCFQKQADDNYPKCYTEVVHMHFIKFVPTKSSV